MAGVSPGPGASPRPSPTLGWMAAGRAPELPTKLLAPSASRPLPTARAGDELLPCLAGALGTQNPEGQSSSCTNHLCRPRCLCGAFWQPHLGRRFGDVAAAPKPAFVLTELLSRANTRLGIVEGEPGACLCQKLARKGDHA